MPSSSRDAMFGVEMLFDLEESSYQRKVDGGAIQLVLYHLEFDIYPYHRAGLSRSLC